MAAVHVTTTNVLGKSVTLLMDDERDAERIAYLKTLERREDLVKVEVKKVPTKAAAK